MPPKKYKSEADKKAANALAKKLKRAAEKEKKIVVNEKNSQWICQCLLEIVKVVPQIVERRRTDAKQKAIKRAAVKEAANILPKRQKYAK